MKITSLQTFFVQPRWLFLRVTTDEGITGWGEPGLEGRAHTSAAAVEDLAEYLLDKNPLEIERHWQVLTKGGFYRGGPILSSAVAGIDQALWDIAGKARGVPAHELLGGPVRDRMRVYGWIGGDRTGEYIPGQIAEEALAQLARGHTALKMNASSQMLPVDTMQRTHEIVTRVEAVRDAIGPEHDIAIDGHGRLSRATAKRILPLLEAYHPLFFEEPTPPEYQDSLRDLTSITSIPIATGERLFSRWDYKRLLDTGVAIWQPDASHAGGISEMQRIVAMAETYDVWVAPHCAIGPIALAACLQVCFASQNVLIQECGLGYSEPGHEDWGSTILGYLIDPSPFDLREGAIERLTKPGLGIEIDERAVEQAAVVGERGHLPTWRHADGSFAEW